MRTLLPKKIFLFLLLPFCISCSSDDKSSYPSVNFEEKIIGTWQYFKYEEGGLSWELDECEKKITYQFFENGTLLAELYLKDEIAECLHQTAPGHWNYLHSENKFEISLDETGTSIVDITFSANYTILTIINKNGEEFIDSFSFIKI